MDGMKRFAVYYAPRPGAFVARAEDWLRGGVQGAAGLTDAARRYGFHGTLRAPFRLADQVTPDRVQAVVAGLAARFAPVVCEGLEIVDLDGFLALVPRGDEAALRDLAARVVEGTDSLRAPLTGAEIGRRRPESLTPRQRDLLARWGYPFVMEEFRFHLTLTDRLPDGMAGPVRAAAGAQFAGVLPEPFVIEDLCLFAEDAAGRFHLLHRYALTG